MVVATILGVAGIGAALASFRGPDPDSLAPRSAAASASRAGSGQPAASTGASGSGPHGDRGDGSALIRAQELTMPLPRPHFVLTDTSGEPFDFAARTAGQVTLLYF